MNLKPLNQLFFFPKKLIENTSFLSLGIFLSFLKSILTIRYAGSVNFGIYQYIFSLVLGTQLFSSAWDWVILRFYNQNDTQKKYIFWGCLHLRFGYALLACLSFFCYFFILKIESYALYPLTAAAITLQIIMGLLRSHMENILSAEREYFTINMLSTASLVMLLITLILGHFFFKIEGLDFIIFLSLATTLLDLFFLILIIRKYFSKIKNRSILQYVSLSTSLRIGIKPHTKHISPLLLTDISGYLKNNLPAVLMGSYGHFEAYAGFHIARKIFQTFYKIIPRILKTMLSQITSATKNENFSKKWNYFTSMYILSQAFAACLFIVLMKNIYFHIYHVKVISEIEIVTFHLGIHLILGAWVQSGTFKVISSDNTKPVLIAAIFSTLGWIAMSMYYTQHNSIAILSSTYWVSFIPTLIIYQWFLLKADKNNIKSILIQLFIVILSIIAISNTKYIYIEVIDLPFKL